MIDELKELFISKWGFIETKAILWTKRVIDGVKLIFFLALILSLFLVLVGFAVNSSGHNGTWIIIAGSFISFITILIALFIFMGPAWAILLILPKTNQKTREIFKHYILPIILWISVINMSFLILPIHKLGLNDIIIFLFATIIATLSSIVLGKKINFVYQAALALSVVIILISIIKIILPNEVISGIIENLFVPIQLLMAVMVQTWYGALFLLGFITMIVLSIIISIKNFTDNVNKTNSSVLSTNISRTLKKFMKIIVYFFIISLVAVVAFSTLQELSPKTAIEVDQTKDKIIDKSFKIIDNIMSNLNIQSFKNKKATIAQENSSKEIDKLLDQAEKDLDKNWINLPYVHQEGSKKIVIKNNEGITLPANIKYYFRIQKGKVIWSYDNTSKNTDFKYIKNGQILELTSKASFYAYQGQAQLTIQCEYIKTK